MSDLTLLRVASLALWVVLGWAVTPCWGLEVPVVVASTGVALHMSGGHPVVGLAPVVVYLLVRYTFPFLCLTLFVGLTVLCHWSLKAFGPNPFPARWREPQPLMVVLLFAAFLILVDVVSLLLGGPSWWYQYHYEIFTWPVIVCWDQIFNCFDDLVEGIWNMMKRFAIPFFVSIAIAGSIPLLVSLGPLPPSTEAVVQTLAFCQRSFFSLVTSVATGLARGGCLGRVLGNLALLCFRSASLLAILPVFLWGHARGAIRGIFENPGAHEPQHMQLVVFQPHLLLLSIVLTADEFDELERREQAKAAAELAEERRFLSGETAIVPRHFQQRDLEQRESRVPRHLTPLQRAHLRAEAKHHLSRGSSATFTPAGTPRYSLGSRYSHDIQQSVRSQPLAQTKMKKDHQSRIESTYRPAPTRSSHMERFFSDQRARPSQSLGTLDPFYTTTHPQRPSVTDLKKLVIGGPRSGPLADFYPGLRVKRPEAYVHPKSPAPIRTQPAVTSTPNYKASDMKKPIQEKSWDMKKPIRDKASDMKKPIRGRKIRESTLSGTVGDSKITKGPKRASGPKTNRDLKTTQVSKTTDKPSSTVAHVTTSSATTNGPSSEQPLTPTTGALVLSPRPGNATTPPKRQEESGPLTETDDGYPAPKRHSPSSPASPKTGTNQPAHDQKPQQQLLQLTTPQPACGQKPQLLKPTTPQQEIATTQPSSAQQPQPEAFNPSQSQTFIPPQSQTFEPSQSQTFIPAQLPLPQQLEQQTSQPPQLSMPQSSHNPQPTIVPPD